MAEAYMLATPSLSVTHVLNLTCYLCPEPAPGPEELFSMPDKTFGQTVKVRVVAANRSGEARPSAEAEMVVG